MTTPGDGPVWLGGARRCQGSWVHALLMVLALSLLAGCASMETPLASQDLRTASDLTDADRRAQLRLELASGYFARGQTVIALDEVKQALAIRPDLAPALELRGLIYAQLSEPVLAEESFKRALQAAPRSADAMHNYAWFLCQQRRWPQADAWFARALAQPGYRDLARTLLARGVCMGQAGQLASAQIMLSQAVQLDPGNPVAAYQLAEVLHLQRDDEAARFHLQRLHAREEAASPQTLWLAVKVDRRRGDRAGVRRWGGALVERFPASPQALRYQEGRFDE